MGDELLLRVEMARRHIELGKRLRLAVSDPEIKEFIGQLLEDLADTCDDLNLEILMEKEHPEPWRDASVESRQDYLEGMHEIEFGETRLELKMRGAGFSEGAIKTALRKPETVAYFALQEIKRKYAPWL